MKKWNKMTDSEAEKNAQKLTLAGQRRSLSGGNIKAESKDRGLEQARERKIMAVGTASLKYMC